MAKRIQSIIVVCALLIAVMTAWAGHASTSLIISHPHAVESAVDAAHSHDDHCADHAHTPLMGDHQHEIPHLGAPPVFKALVTATLIRSDWPYPLPNAPVFQIKRPPRPQSVI